MNTEFDSIIKNNQYEGNGWSKYQILVLQQLDDHNKVLQNLNKEIVELKQSCAVSDTEFKMWKTQVGSSLEQLSDDIDNILYEENGLNFKVRNLEKKHEIEEKSDVKLKAMWAVFGAIIVFLVNAGAKIIEFFWK